MSAVGQELLSTLDQRCTADIEEFAVDTAVLYGNLIKPAIEIVSFSAQIWADQGPRQLGIFLAYFLLSSKWLQVIPPLPSCSHLLGHISPICSRFFPVFCAFSPSRRGGSNEPQAETQG